MRLSSGDCLKFVQVALLYKLDVIYSKSISNDVVSVPSTGKITLMDMYRESRYKDFCLLVEKIELSFKPYGCKVFSVSLQKHVSLTGMLLSPHLFSYCLVAQSS